MIINVPIMVSMSHNGYAIDNPEITNIEFNVSYTLDTCIIPYTTFCDNINNYGMQWISSKYGEDHHMLLYNIKYLDDKASTLVFLPEFIQKLKSHIRKKKLEHLFSQ